MTSTGMLLGASAIVASLIYFLSRPSTSRLTKQIDPSTLPSALLPSYTSHARLLPKPSKHAFSYPLIYLGMDVDSLESGSLDLPSRLFKYGGSPWTKVLGLRSWNYLTPGPDSLRQKLDRLLEDQGVGTKDKKRAWIVTMPSMLGFEGINPLTVWFVYAEDRGLSCIVLEVHNTFGEKHAYVLKTASEHSVDPNEGYDQAWIFPRTFHVSPFNSRNGYYRLDILDPFPTSHPHPTPSPQYKVFLRLLTPDKTVKLTAIVASHPKHQPILIDPSNSWRIVHALLRWPLSLVLSTPRILYHAYILQCIKKLAMFPRPEPRGEGQEGVWNPPQNYADGTGLAIGWQDVPSSERWLERVFIDWAEKRTKETGIEVQIKRADHHHSTMLSTSIAKSDDKTNESVEKARTVKITTSDPYFYTNLFLTLSPRHYTVLAPELLTSISDHHLFEQFLTPASSDPSKVKDNDTQTQDWITRTLAHLRSTIFKWYIAQSTIPPLPNLHPCLPYSHFTDDLPKRTKWWVYYTLSWAYFGARIEEGVMDLISAKFVDGGAPWQIWERALKRLYKAEKGSSVDEDVAEEWEDLGSIQYAKTDA